MSKKRKRGNEGPFVMVPLTEASERAT